MRRYCVNYTSQDVEVLELSSKEQLVNYTMVRRATNSWQGNVPYALGVVELPEGVRVRAEVVDCDFGDLRLGMPMEMTVRIGGNSASGNPVAVYKWTPAAESTEKV